MNKSITTLVFSVLFCSTASASFLEQAQELLQNRYVAAGAAAGAVLGLTGLYLLKRSGSKAQERAVADMVTELEIRGQAINGTIVATTDVTPKQKKRVTFSDNPVSDVCVFSDEFDYECYATDVAFVLADRYQALPYQEKILYLNKDLTDVQDQREKEVAFLAAADEDSRDTFEHTITLLDIQIELIQERIALYQEQLDAYQAAEQARIDVILTRIQEEKAQEAVTQKNVATFLASVETSAQNCFAKVQKTVGKAPKVKPAVAPKPKRKPTEDASASAAFKVPTSKAGSKVAAIQAKLFGQQDVPLMAVRHDKAAITDYSVNNQQNPRGIKVLPLEDTHQ